MNKWMEAVLWLGPTKWMYPKCFPSGLKRYRSQCMREPEQSLRLPRIVYNECHIGLVSLFVTLLHLCHTWWTSLDTNTDSTQLLWLHTFLSYNLSHISSHMAMKKYFHVEYLVPLIQLTSYCGIPSKKNVTDTCDFSTTGVKVNSKFHRSCTCV